MLELKYKSINWLLFSIWSAFCPLILQKQTFIFLWPVGMGFFCILEQLKIYQSACYRHTHFGACEFVHLTVKMCISEISFALKYKKPHLSIL